MLPYGTCRHFPRCLIRTLFVQAEVRQSVDADVKKAKADSEIDVKELYYDIYEQVRSFAFSSLASGLFPINLGLKWRYDKIPLEGFPVRKYFLKAAK